MLSGVTATVSERGLGLPQTLALPICVVGCCSSGDVAEPTLVTGPDALTDAFGYGPAVSLAAKVLKEAGGPILFGRITTATAGALGAYSQTGAGSAAAGTASAGGSNTSTAVPALTGTAASHYAIRIKVTTAGANIAANPAVQISLDGGLTWFAADATNVSATPTAIGSTGLLLAWTDGTFVLNDYWTASGAACPTTGDATGGTVLTLSGTPRDRYDVVIKVTRAAATPSAGTGAVRVSLDGGETYQPEQPVPTSGSLVLTNTGITVAFSAATLVVGDFYYFKTSAPVFDATGLDSMLEELEEVTTPDHEGTVIVGDVDATMFDEIEDSHDRLIAASKLRWFLAHARDQGSALQDESVSTWTASLIGATPGFAGSNANFVMVAAGAALIDDDTLSGLFRRSIAFALASRIAGIDVKEHPGRVRSGPLSIDSIVHDLAASDCQVLDTNGFIGAQSIQGVNGYYATDATRAAAGNDFTTVMRVRVMCFAARAAIARFAEEINDEVPANADGTIRADVADGLDRAITAYMATELKGRCSSVSVQVDRAADIVSTETLPFKLRIWPLGYAKAVTVNLGFTLTRSN